MVDQAGLALGAVDRDHQLLARRERLGPADRVGDGDHARLGGEDVCVGGLEVPQRPQAERVHGEQALVAVAGHQRHRALGEGAEGLAQVHVEAAQLLGHSLDLVDDRRQRELERLHQREAAAADQRLDRAVEVLGVRRPVPQRDADHPGLLAQPRDRVDLAVVAEHAERLDALERGPGVGRVAVVAEDHRGLHPRVEQIGEVAAERERAPQRLVHDGVRGAAGHVQVEL